MPRSTSCSSRARGGGQLLLVEGHAGIGKTRAARRGRRRARERRRDGHARARRRSSRATSRSAIALQLFEPLLAGADDETHDRLLAGSAALAGPLLERPTSWGGDEGDDRSYSVIHGLFWLLSNLAESGPVLIAIDDGHWADRASLRLVLYLLQRLDETAVGDRRRAPPRRARRARRPARARSPRTRRAAPCARRRCRATAAGAIVAAALPGADEAFADACWRMTEGNCFLLGELVARRRGARAGSRPRSNAARIGTSRRRPCCAPSRCGSCACPTTRPASRARSRCSARTRSCATSPRSPAATPRRVAAAADALAAARDPAPGRPRRADASPTRCSPRRSTPTSAPASARRCTGGRPRSCATRASRPSASRRTCCRAPGSGEDWVVDVLCAAAGHALAHGAPESAASYLRRALDEPPSATARARRAAPARPQRGRDRAADGDRAPRGGARGRRSTTPSARTRCSSSVARCAVQRAATPRRWRRSTRRPQLDGADAAVAAQARAEAVALGLLDRRRRARAARAARAADARASAGPDAAPPAARDAVPARGDARRLVRGRARARRRALDGDALVADQGGGERARRRLARAARVRRARLERPRAQRRDGALARARVDDGVRDREPAARPRRAGRRAGSTRRSSDAEQAVDAERYGWRQFLPRAYGMLVEPARRSRRARGRGRAAPARLDVRRTPARRCSRRGTRRSGAWRSSSAARPTRSSTSAPGATPSRASATRPASPAGARRRRARWRRSGARRGERAARAEELELARRFGAPRAISVALREVAHASARGDLDEPIALLDEAVAIVAASEARLEHCRALLELGTVLRRGRPPHGRGPRARRGASSSRATCGARLLQERARAELEVAGTRVQRAARRGADALSPSERRVVALAIEGLSNRQIAEALFVTRKAVEWHLGNAFRKLDVRSRGELAARSASGAGRALASADAGGRAAGGDVVDEAARVRRQPAVGVDELLREVLDRGELVVGVAVDSSASARRADDLRSRPREAAWRDPVAELRVIMHAGAWPAERASLATAGAPTCRPCRRAASRCAGRSPRGRVCTSSRGCRRRRRRVAASSDLAAARPRRSAAPRRRAATGLGP